jgi:hypothetical protein
LATVIGKFIIRVCKSHDCLKNNYQNLIKLTLQR